MMSGWSFWWGGTTNGIAVGGDTMPLAQILADFHPISRPPPWSWDDEEQDLLTRRICACCGEPGHHQAKLEAYFSENPLTEGVVLSTDGWVLDGHHRIVAARRLGIEMVPLESPEDSQARWLRDYGPVSWQERQTGDFSPEEWGYLQSVRGERRHRNGRNLQLPACDRCTQGVMDATNSHYLGICSCPCHEPGPKVARGHEWAMDGGDYAEEYEGESEDNAAGPEASSPRNQAVSEDDN